MYDVWKSSCRSIMLRQEELAFIEALSTLQLSPAVLNELTMALSCRQKKPLVPAGNSSTMSGGGGRVPPTFIESARRQPQSQRTSNLGGLL